MINGNKVDFSNIEIFNAAWISDAAYLQTEEEIASFLKEKTGANKVKVATDSHRSETGCHNIFVQLDDDHTVYLGIKGTDAWSNLIDDVKIAAGSISEAASKHVYKNLDVVSPAMELYEALKKEGKFPNKTDVVIVGHSLGGAAATYVAAKLGCRSIAFDPPGITETQAEILQKFKTDEEKALTILFTENIVNQCGAHLYGHVKRLAFHREHIKMLKLLAIEASSYIMAHVPYSAAVFLLLFDGMDLTVNKTHSISEHLKAYKEKKASLTDVRHPFSPPLIKNNNQVVAQKGASLYELLFNPHKKRNEAISLFVNHMAERCLGFQHTDPQLEQDKKEFKKYYDKCRSVPNLYPKKIRADFFEDFFSDRNNDKWIRGERVVQSLHYPDVTKQSARDKLITSYHQNLRSNILKCSPDLQEILKSRGETDFSLAMSRIALCSLDYADYGKGNQHDHSPLREQGNLVTDDEKRDREVCIEKIGSHGRSVEKKLSQTLSSKEENQEDLNLKHQQARDIVKLGADIMTIIPNMEKHADNFKKMGYLVCDVAYIATCCYMGLKDPVSGFLEASSKIFECFDGREPEPHYSEILNHKLDEMRLMIDQGFHQTHTLLTSISKQVQVVENKLDNITLTALCDARVNNKNKLMRATQSNVTSNNDNGQIITTFKDYDERTYKAWVSRLRDKILTTGNKGPLAGYQAGPIEEQTLCDWLNFFRSPLELVEVLDRFAKKEFGYKKRNTELANPIVWATMAPYILTVEFFRFKNKAPLTRLEPLTNALDALISRGKALNNGIKQLVKELEDQTQKASSGYAAEYKAHYEKFSADLSGFSFELLAEKKLQESSTTTKMDFYLAIWDECMAKSETLGACYAKLDRCATILRAVALSVAWFKGDFPLANQPLGAYDYIPRASTVHRKKYHKNLHCFAEIADIILQEYSRDGRKENESVRERIQGKLNAYFSQLIEQNNSIFKKNPKKNPIEKSCKLLKDYLDLVQPIPHFWHEELYAIDDVSANVGRVVDSGSQIATNSSSDEEFKHLVASALDVTMYESASKLIIDIRSWVYDRWCHHDSGFCIVNYCRKLPPFEKMYGDAEKIDLLIDPIIKTLGARAKEYEANPKDHELSQSQLMSSIDVAVAASIDKIKSINTGIEQLITDLKTFITLEYADTIAAKMSDADIIEAKIVKEGVKCEDNDVHTVLYKLSLIQKRIKEASTFLSYFRLNLRFNENKWTVTADDKVNEHLLIKNFLGNLPEIDSNENQLSNDNDTSDQLVTSAPSPSRIDSDKYVAVYVWLPSCREQSRGSCQHPVNGGLGHVALRVYDKASKIDTYLSVRPGHTLATKAIFQSYDQDLYTEDNNMPDTTIKLYGLNVDAMATLCDKFKKSIDMSQMHWVSHKVLTNSESHQQNSVTCCWSTLKAGGLPSLSTWLLGLAGPWDSALYTQYNVGKGAIAYGLFDFAPWRYFFFTPKCFLQLVGSAKEGELLAHPESMKWESLGPSCSMLGMKAKMALFSLGLSSVLWYSGKLQAVWIDQFVSLIHQKACLALEAVKESQLTVGLFSPTRESTHLKISPRNFT